MILAAAAVGAFVMNRLDERNFQAERDQAAELGRRIDSLVTTVEELEGKNNELVAENQGLKDQLKTAEDKRLEEEKKNKLVYNTQELGKRLMTFNLERPKTYFEFDKNFGAAKVESNRATFASNVVAEGIEVSFAGTTLKVIIEPWKISGRALEEVERFKVATADGKEAIVAVVKDTNNRFTVNGMIVSGDTADNLKVMVTNTVAQDQLDNAKEQVRDILRSLEIDFKQL
jgi:hypothetical protein